MVRKIELRVSIDSFFLTENRNGRLAQLPPSALFLDGRKRGWDHGRFASAASVAADAQHPNPEAGKIPRREIVRPQGKIDGADRQWPIGVPVCRRDFFARSRTP